MDFPIDEQRLDTAYVCDSTLLRYHCYLADQNKADVVYWKLYLCDRNGQKKGNPITIDGPVSGKTEHKFYWKFVVDEQLDLPPEQRDPYTYYSLDIERYKNHLICTDLPPDADTLRTMIRVHRAYNDTTWRIICETDTVHFFKKSDRLVDKTPNVGKNDETIFKFKTNDPSTNTVSFQKAITAGLANIHR